MAIMDEFGRVWQLAAHDEGWMWSGHPGKIKDATMTAPPEVADGGVRCARGPGPRRATGGWCPPAAGPSEWDCRCRSWRVVPPWWDGVRRVVLAVASLVPRMGWRNRQAGYDSDRRTVSDRLRTVGWSNCSSTHVEEGKRRLGAP